MTDKKKHKAEKEKEQVEIQEEVISQEETETQNQEQSENQSQESDRLAELEETLISRNDQFLRLQAEFDNYRKRTLKEKMELTKSAGESILSNILPLIDDFERGLAAMETALDIQAVKEGIMLINKRFNDFVAQNGVKEIEAINCPLDTDLHEAVTKIPAPSKELKGKVVDVIQKGYTLNDKVIRFAKVVIGE